MLDLGVWMALQSVVEKLHRSQWQELNALCSTAEKAWEEFYMVRLTNVYERWKMVLDLILKDNDGDKFIETNRGKLFGSPSREAEDLDEESGSVAVDIEDMTAEDTDIINLGLD